MAVFFGYEFSLIFYSQLLLATTSTDGKCRIFSTFIKGVDTKYVESSLDCSLLMKYYRIDLEVTDA